MSKTKYPYTAWKLTPMMRPVEITIVSESFYRGRETLASGARLPTSEIFKTKNEAIVEGWHRIEVQKLTLAARQAKLEKKIATLSKAQEQAA